jgi:hypothetical protein
LFEGNIVQVRVLRFVCPVGLKERRECTGGQRCAGVWEMILRIKKVGGRSGILIHLFEVEGLPASCLMPTEGRRTKASMTEGGGERRDPEGGESTEEMN